MRFHVADFEDHAVGINVGNGERHVTVLHPVTGLPRRGVDKDHRGVVGHVGAPHHAGHLMRAGERHFRDQFFRAHPDFDRRQLRLRLFREHVFERRLRGSGVGGRAGTARVAGRIMSIATVAPRDRDQREHQAAGFDRKFHVPGDGNSVRRK